MDERADGLISCFYDAATDERKWPELMAHIVDEFDAVGATYFVFEKSTKQTIFWCNFGHDIAMENVYTDHFMKIDPTLELALQSEVGSVLQSHDHFSKRYIDHSEYFQDFLIPSGLGNVAGAKIIDESELVGMFSIQHSSDVWSMQERNRNLLGDVLPHLIRAAEIHWKLKRLKIKANVTEVGLELSRQAMIVVDCNRHVQYMNAAGQSLVSSGCGLAIYGGVLRFADTAREKELQAAVAIATSTVPRLSKNKLINLSHGVIRTFLSIVPVSMPHLALINNGRHALVMASPPLPTEETFNELTGDTFSLTKAEKVLAFRLFCGLTLNEIAVDLGLSRETLRSQLRSILIKTGTNRQGQLLSILQQIAACIPSESTVY